MEMVLTNSLEWIALMALDEVPGSILGKTKLGNEFFLFGTGLGVHGMNSVALIVIVQGISFSFPI